MRNCTRCKYARWDRTGTGRLSPTGDGRCDYKYQTPELPPSMYWLGRLPPAPSGGAINRRTELTRHCPYYEETE